VSTLETLSKQVGLIPRYNWDFGLRELGLGMLGILKNGRTEFHTLRQEFGD